MLLWTVKERSVICLQGSRQNIHNPSYLFFFFFQAYKVKLQRNPKLSSKLFLPVGANHFCFVLSFERTQTTTYKFMVRFIIYSSFFFPQEENIINTPNFRKTKGTCHYLVLTCGGHTTVIKVVPFSIILIICKSSI